VLSLVMVSVQSSRIVMRISLETLFGIGSVRNIQAEKCISLDLYLIRERSTGVNDHDIHGRSHITFVQKTTQVFGTTICYQPDLPLR
jgi:hypothetical protein